MFWRPFNLPRKIAGSNKCELKLLHLLTNPSGWSVWPGLKCTVLRCGAGILDESVRQVAGMLITNSRGMFDALTRSESPQLRMRVNTSTMLADCLTTTGYPARAVMESFLVKKRWRCTFDPTFESGRRRKARGALLFSQEDLDEINPSTESVAFDTQLQDESISEDVREIMHMKYE